MADDPGRRPRCHRGRPGHRLGRFVTTFRPSTWSRALRAGSSAADDVARSLRGLPIPNAFKSSQLADDLADIGRIIAPTNRALIHAGAVNAASTMGDIGNIVRGISAATHNWVDLTDIGETIDELTKYEIPTQTW